jgi:hypothetical protein
MANRGQEDAISPPSGFPIKAQKVDLEMYNRNLLNRNFLREDLKPEID